METNIVEQEEPEVILTVAQDQIQKDLKYLKLDLKRQLKDPKVKKFWDKTLGETLASGRVKMQRSKNEVVW